VGHPRSRHSPTLWARELLDAVVVAVSDEDVPAPIHGDAPGNVELPVPAASAAPASEERPAVRVLPDGGADVVADEDAPAPLDAHPRYVGDPRIRHAPARVPHLLLAAVVAALAHEDVPAAIHGDAGGAVELPVPAAQAAPLGEECPGVRELL